MTVHLATNDLGFRETLKKPSLGGPEGGRWFGAIALR